MAIAYTPPSATVTELTSPSVNPLIAPSANICLIGLAGNYTTTSNPISVTDTVILQGTNPVTLPTIALLNNNAQLVAVSKVLDVLNPSVGTPPGSGYVATTDYVINAGEGPPQGTAGTIARASGSGIPDGGIVSVSYTYIPSDYYSPIRLFDIGSVEQRFGDSWATGVSSTTGSIYDVGVNSQLSMAARLAFENGAQSVICQPLFARSTPGNPGTTPVPPSGTAIGSSGTWSDTLYSLRSIRNIDVIVPVIGQDNNNVSDSSMLAIFGAVQAHLAYMNSNQEYIIALFGEDGTIEGPGAIGANGVATGLMNTVRNVHAPYLQSSYGNALSGQCVLINNTVFQRAVPGLNTTINLGGQYAAAALAGALSARAVSQAMTRQPLLGFQSVTDPRTPQDKNLDAGAGLMVIEQVNGVVRCRQQTTLDIQNVPQRSELSVVRSKFVMMQSVQATLDDQIIGNIIADANSPLIVRSAISSVLSLLQQQQVIVGYTNVTAQLSSLNPTTITASFAYQPAFPVNFIKVTFSMDLTTGQISVSESTA
jgi:hypothetical protein